MQIKWTDVKNHRRGCTVFFDNGTAEYYPSMDFCIAEIIALENKMNLLNEAMYKFGEPFMKQVNQVLNSIERKTK